MYVSYLLQPSAHAADTFVHNVCTSNVTRKDHLFSIWYYIIYRMDKGYVPGCRFEHHVEAGGWNQGGGTEGDENDWIGDESISVK